jgi:hypothetical protein
LFDENSLPSVEADVAPFLFKADNAVNFVRPPELAKLFMANAAFRAVEFPAGLVVHLASPARIGTQR